jgi:hypothetical protein
MVLRFDSTSNRNEYQECFLGDKGGRCVRLTTLPPSCAVCLGTWEPPSPGTLSACPDLYRDRLTYVEFNVIYQLLTKYGAFFKFFKKYELK